MWLPGEPPHAQGSQRTRAHDLKLVKLLVDIAVSASPQFCPRHGRPTPCDSLVARCGKFFKRQCCGFPAGRPDAVKTTYRLDASLTSGPVT